MSSPFTVEAFGTQLLASRFKDEIRAFKREQRKQLRAAANMVKTDVVHEVQNRFASRGPHKGPSGKPLGPLDRSIGVRILNTTADLVALIRPRARAFYGRFLETGLNTTRHLDAKGKWRQRQGGTQRPFHLPRIPYLEPVAIADADKVAATLGESYGVFYRGGAVAIGGV